jgi:hypothetical protein
MTTSLKERILKAAIAAPNTIKKETTTTTDVAAATQITSDLPQDLQIRDKPFVVLIRQFENKELYSALFFGGTAFEHVNSITKILQRVDNYIWFNHKHKYVKELFDNAKQEEKASRLLDLLPFSRHVHTNKTMTYFPTMTFVNLITGK